MRNILLSSLKKETTISLISAGIALIFLSLFFFPGETEKTVQKILPAPTITSKPIISSTPTKEEVQDTTIPTNEPTTQPQVIQITVVITPTPTPKTASNKATIHVIVTGVGSFDVSLDKGKNQCDVLTQARNDNKITQLLIKYDSSLDSYGVYQINNLGKDNAVWWAYEVNGKSPSMGCNHVAANDGDTVSWKYIGS